MNAPAKILSLPPKTARLPFSSKTMDITPQIAVKMLEKNAGFQREPMRQVVERYALDMANGDWHLNGEAIIFSDTDKLLEGQHRLLAVVKSNSAIKTVVTSGVKEAAFHTINSGARRQPHQVLRIAGENNPFVLAASLVVLNAWLKRKDAHIQRGVTTSQMFTMLNKYPDIRYSAAHHGGAKLPIYPSVMAFIHFVAQYNSDDDGRAAGRFMKAITGHLDTKDGKKYSAPVLLRQMMVHEKEMQKKQRRGRSSREYQTGLTIKAWNHFYRGQGVDFLDYQPGDPWPEFANLKGARFPGRVKA